MRSFVVDPVDAKDFGPCECCGNNSRRVWGNVHAANVAIASYFVHRTLARVADHGANFDLILGHWGERATAANRCLVSLAYRLDETGPSFMVIDAAGRPVANWSAKQWLVTKSSVSQLRSRLLTSSMRF